jgi:CcmD family protein
MDSGSYVVLGAILVIWFGILGYLVALDRRVNQLSRKVRNDET